MITFCPPQPKGWISMPLNLSTFWQIVWCRVGLCLLRRFHPASGLLCTLAVLGLAALTPQAAGESRCDAVRVQVLGSGGPELDDGRFSSAYLVWHRDQARFLLDAGSGSSIAFGAAGAKLADLEAILLSHLHTDHAGDIPGLVKGSFFSVRRDDLIVAGPGGNSRIPSTTTFFDRLIGPDGAFSYLSSYLEAGAEAYTLKPVSMPSDKGGNLGSADWLARSLPVPHGPIPAVA